MSGRTRSLAAGAVVGGALAVIGNSNGVASDTETAIGITVGVCVVLAVVGLLALLVYRMRRSRLTYRPDPGITRARMHAEVVDVSRPGRDRAPALQPVVRRDVRHGEFVVREVPSIETR